jgi:hypothetical protein
VSDEHPPETEQPAKGPLKDYSSELASPDSTKDTDQVVEKWFDDHIRGSIVTRDTQVWNHIMACKDRLKEALRKL